MSQAFCNDCKWAGDRGCAVNPEFWQMWQEIEKRMPSKTAELFKNNILPCPNWQETDLLSVFVVLTENEWAHLFNSIGNTQVIVKIKDQLRSQYPEATNLVEARQPREDDCPF